MDIYLVGGAVRDKLLGYPFHEHDWVVVGATPEQLLEQGYRPVGRDFPVFLHPQTKEEYALARTERKTAPGYTGFACHASPAVTLEEDLQRRDLTINAMAEDADGHIIDPYGGQHDLSHRLLRHVSPAFTEDPLRVLRVARFCARYAHLGFTLAPDTLQLMQQLSAGGELQALPAERIWKELERALGERSPQQFFSCLQQSNALEVLIPELPATSWQHLDQAAARHNTPAVCFALLFFSLDQHAAEALCQRLKCPNDFKQLALLVSRLGKQCQQPLTTPEALLTLLEQLDPFRRPTRFELFLQCCEIHFQHTRCSAQLRQALALCSSLNAAELAAEGLTGKAIAQALRQRRLDSLAHSLFTSQERHD